MAPANDENEDSITIKITGRGIDLERRLPLSWLPRLTHLLFGGAEDVAGTVSLLHTPEATRASPASSGGLLERPVGIAEYIREKRPQTASDTILVLAGHLELSENRRPFGRDDLRRLMRAARIPEPANFPRDVGVAVAKGYIQPLGDGFQLTNTGLELVGHPGPLIAPRGRGGLRGRRKPREGGEAPG